MASAIKSEHLCVVLVSTRNPLNLGAAARAISNFGFSRLRVVNPYAMAFREARSAVGASHILASAEEYGSVAAAVADCSLVVGTTAVGKRDLHHALRPLEQGARLIRKGTQGGQVALLFGSEKVGLPNDALSHCHWLMHIPTAEENISMNLGQAVAVCLYELVRINPPASRLTAKLRAEPSAPAPAADMERITGLLLEAMVASGYLKRKPTADASERLRRLVRRLKLPARDTVAWQGILRQILWKLEH